ncbi:hypothetical protein CPC08DRAFT_235142 [Agrocybe pediades]|nr:hypothetical protein CPC08DRAFT_235142 [Agrocybe pediades]
MNAPEYFTQPPHSQRGEINLGCLTLDKEDPWKECYHPVEVAAPSETKVEAITLEAFQKSFSSTEPNASVLTTSTAMKENSVTVYKMANQLDWFDDALRNEGVRSWIGDRLKQKGNIYLVVGYCILDRTTVLAKDEQVTPLSTPIEERPAILQEGVDGQSLGVEQALMRRNQSRKSSLNTTFEGDIIYAVQYQKLKFGNLLGGRKAERAQIGIDGGRWTLMEFPRDEVGTFFQPKSSSKTPVGKSRSFSRIMGKKLLER